MDNASELPNQVIHSPQINNPECSGAGFYIVYYHLLSLLIYICCLLIPRSIPVEVNTFLSSLAFIRSTWLLGFHVWSYFHVNWFLNFQAVCILCSFQCTYPTWESSDDGRQFLSTLQNFKEKQIHQGRLQDNSHTWTWQAIRGLRVRHEIIHRFPSGNVFSGNGGFPRYDHHPGSVWLTNHEQRNHPYILDWYYTSKPLEDPENPEDSPSSEKEIAFESIQDFHATQSNLPTEVKNTDQSWDLPFSDRLQSHIEASTSGSLFKNSAPQDLDRHIMHHRWWDRTALTSSVAQASFLEPPSFGHHDYSHHSDDVHGSGGEYLGNLQRLSETSDVGEADDEVLDLPFVDSYDGSLKNLTVRIPRMSDDRIHWYAHITTDRCQGL